MRPFDSRRVLDAFLSNASKRAERSIAHIRTWVSVVVGVREFVLDPERFAHGLAKEVVVAVALLIGIVMSMLSLRSLRRKGDFSRVVMTSTVTDAVFVFLLLVGMVAWPGDTYRGFLRQFDAAAVAVATAVIGFRFVRGAAIVGILLNFVSFAVLVALDLTRNSTRVTYNAGDVVLAFTIISGAAAAGYFMSVRTRHLVADGAAAVLRAATVRHTLGAHLSDEVAAQAINQPDVGGKRREVAVLFSDLRGFTAYAEKLSPEELVGQLNGYLEVMVPIIRDEGGVIDKFVGDAIMATFGAVETRGDEAARAIRTAVSMHVALQSHNEQRRARGLPALNQGLGVHYGPVVAGNVGTADRLEFTVIGDVVNVASRLESATKQEGVPILLSREAVAEARLHPGTGGLPELRPHGAVQVRGRDQSIEVFTVVLDAARQPPR